MEKRNIFLEKGKILIIIIVISILVTLLFVGTKNNLQTNDKPNNVEINDNQEELDKEEIIEEETEYIPYKTELPKFTDSFEKALFVYSWFYDINDLFPYLDQNNEIDEEWYLLKATELTSIEDMKEYAYEVFEQKFIDKKFAEILDEEYPLFKETKEGILVNSGFVSQYGPYLGYDGTYKKIVNKDGTISYKVTIKGDVASGPSEDSCNTEYEYKMTKNTEGKLVFKNFEYPTNICLKDMD